MSGQQDGQGAAELLGLWQAEYGLGQDPAVLVLSGGDNWTGPAISTWFDGQGMVEVMNALGYTASAIGNHEFDFGLEVLQARLEQADFPFLSANLHRHADGTVPAELGIQPYAILEVAGLQVGIIGLSGTNTPYVANPAYLADFDFIDYQPTLRQYVPQLRAEGAEIILVIAHVCPDELELLALQVADLEIAMLAGGHCHIGYARQSGDTAIIASPGNLSGYAVVILDHDPRNGQTRLVDLDVQANQGGRADPGVAQIIAGWQARTDAELDVEIGYLAGALPEDSQPMQDLITESWIWAYPNADIALTNLGGMRADLPAGMLTIAEVISVLPFNNVIVEVHLTGAQLLDVLGNGRDALAIGGMHWQGSGWVVENSGAALDAEALYSVLVNDYMYAGGDGYTMLMEYDPEAYQTGIDWRQPVIDWILAQESSPEAPLDAAIAALGD
jgi:2',3'-cyclic-nucleotide 2'-phosphodiesterase (5'-nucleotidase family)